MAGGSAAPGAGTAKVCTTASGSGSGGGRGAGGCAGGALVTDVIGAHNRPGVPHGALQALASMAATQSISTFNLFGSISSP